MKRVIQLIIALGLPVTVLGQTAIVAPQVAVTGNVGCVGFPCLNSGALNFTADANQTMTALQTSANGGIAITSSVSLTATRTLTVPSGNFQFMDIENKTTGGQIVTVCSVSGGSCINIPNGQTIAGVWYDGANFVAPTAGGGGGSITGVTAGTGLSGGGTSGTVTVNLATPVAVANGGTGTASPSIVAGSNITVTGTWPNQTVNSTAGGGTTSNAVTFAASGGGSPGTTFNGSAAVTVSPTTLGLTTTPAFSSIASGANTTMVGTCGTGCSLTPTDTGVVGANQVNGLVVPVNQGTVGTNGTGQLVPGTLSSTHIGGEEIFLNFLPAYISGTTVTDISGNGNNAALCTGAGAPSLNSLGVSFQSNPNSCINLPTATNNLRSFEFSFFQNATGMQGNQYTDLLGPNASSTSATILMGNYQNTTDKWGGAAGISLFNNASNAVTTSTYTYTPAGNHTVIVTYGTNSSTDPDHVYFDGTEISPYLNQGANSRTLGTGYYVLGLNGVLGLAPNINLYEFLGYTTELTAAQAAQETAATFGDMTLRGTSPPTTTWSAYGPRFDAYGDSLTYCFDSTAGYCWVGSMTLPSYVPTFAITNYGNPGKTSQYVLSTTATIGITNCGANTGPNVAAIFDGTNDFSNLNLTTPALTSQTIAKQIAVLKSAGCKVLVGTMISRVGSAQGGTVNGLSWAQNKNGLDPIIRQNWQAWGADGLLDFAADPSLGCDYCAGSPITNLALTTNVLTVTAANNWTSGTVVTFTGVGTNTFLNTTTCTVSGTGLSSTSFQCPYTHANVTSVADTGYSYNAAIYQNDQTHLTNAGYALMTSISQNAFSYLFGYTKANPNLITAATYSMTAGDVYTEYSGTAATTYTLPTCIGQSGAVYILNNQTAHVITLKNLNSTQPINGTDYSTAGLALTAGKNFEITDVPNVLGATAGCHWSY
jgi:hypothetical protein